MDKIENVDLREALREIAGLNTYFHLENDLGISIEQMERAAKINDYNDKTLIWVSYPAGIDCYAEREVFQKDTRGYNGVLYHGGGAENELKCAYAVDVSGIRDGRVRGSLYEIDIKNYADNVRINAVATNSIRIYVNDPHGNGEQLVMPKAEFDRRYPLDLVKMAYWHNEPTDPEALKTVLGNVWNNDRDGKYKTCDMWAHTTKLYDNRFTFYANQLMESLNKHQYPNSTDKQSFTTSLDGRIAFALNPEQLGRLLETLPYKNAVFTVERRALDMKLVVPKDEVLQARGERLKDKLTDKSPVKADKSEKPSLLATLEANEQKSKQQFGGQRAEPGKDLSKKNRGEEL